MSHRVKKSLGQHFLNDLHLAERIADSLKAKEKQNVLEVGPGQGVLTQFLVQKNYCFKAIELDDNLIPVLRRSFPQLGDDLIHFDFLKARLERIFEGESFSVIGNFPYNISSQIIFKIIKYRDLIPEMVGMFQKELAERIISAPGSKAYGVISVLAQAYYTGEMLFSVPPGSFSPPPKVNSAVIRLDRIENPRTDYNPSFFKSIVKAAFRQRRKMLRNSLKSYLKEGTEIDPELLMNRPEQLSVDEFIEISKKLEQHES